MCRLLFLFVVSIGWSIAHAAILVTSDDRGNPIQQYFDQGAMVVVDGGQPRFGVDAAGNCWLLSRGQLVIDPCEAVFDSLADMQQRLMAGLGPRELAMMQSMMGGGGGTAAAAIEPSGGRTIAGYPANCHRVGGDREICVSERLLNEIVAEMGDSRFLDLVRRFGETAANLGPLSPGTEAIARLLQQGYPMSDKRRATAGIPGVDPAMLRFLPEAQRAQLMQQFGAGAGGGQMAGSQVVSVERGVQMPDPGLERYPRQSFTQYLQQSMGGVGGMPPGMR
jgi:hypothetical protein